MAGVTGKHPHHAVVYQIHLHGLLFESVTHFEFAWFRFIFSHLLMGEAVFKFIFVEKKNKKCEELVFLLSTTLTCFLLKL